MTGMYNRMRSHTANTHTHTCLRSQNRYAPLDGLRLIVISLLLSAEKHWRATHGGKTVRVSMIIAPLLLPLLLDGLRYR